MPEFSEATVEKFNQLRWPHGEWSYSVAPRFTPGSPALVSCRQASRVAAQELEFHADALTGIAGPDHSALAEKPDALRGIVEAQRSKRNGLEVYDVLTGAHFWRGSVAARDLQTGDRIVDAECTVFTYVPVVVRSATREHGPLVAVLTEGSRWFYPKAHHMVKVERTLPGEVW